MLLLMLEGSRGSIRGGPISSVSVGPRPQQVMTVTYRPILAFYLGLLSYPNSCIWEEEDYMVNLGDNPSSNSLQI